MRMHAKYNNNNIIHINLLIVYAYIGLLPMGIGEAQWPLPDEDEGDHPSIKRSADRDEEGDQCMQSALGEGDREGNNFCANLEDRDKETEVLGGIS